MAYCVAMALAVDPSFEQFQQYFGNGVGTVLALTYYVLLAVAMWRVFSKAGYLGILAFIPIVNWFIQVKIAGFSAWWGLLALIPIVNVVFTIIVVASLYSIADIRDACDQQQGVLAKTPGENFWGYTCIEKGRHP